jgi:hypothetical protein
MALPFNDDMVCEASLTDVKLTPWRRISKLSYLSILTKDYVYPTGRSSRKSFWTLID